MANDASIRLDSSHHSAVLPIKNVIASAQSDIEAHTQSVASKFFSVMATPFVYAAKALRVVVVLVGFCAATPLILADTLKSALCVKEKAMKVSKHVLSLYFCHFKYLAGLGSYFHQIDEHIILCGLPTTSHIPFFDRLKFFKENHIGTVISMNEDFELDKKTSTFVTDATPITKELWQTNDIEFKHHPTADFIGLDAKTLDDAVESLNTAIVAGKKVAIHCKAGVGRSATAVIGYYIKYKGYSAEKAIAFVKKQRPDTNLNKNQIKQIHKYAVQLAVDALPMNQKASCFKTVEQDYPNNHNAAIEFKPDKLTTLLTGHRALSSIDYLSEADLAIITHSKTVTVSAG